MKKHKVDMDADRKKRGLPAFVPRPRSVNSLEPEERRQVADDNDEDYEVTGLMCDSDGDCDCLDMGSRENTFRIFDDFPDEPDYEIVCGVCEAEEETTTILLDVSRVVLPPADEAGEAETHHVLGALSALLTLLIYAVGTSYVLCFDWTNRGPEFPTLWPHTLSIHIKTIDAIRVLFIHGWSVLAFDAASIIVFYFP